MRPISFSHLRAMVRIQLAAAIAVSVVSSALAQQQDSHEGHNHGPVSQVGKPTTQPGLTPPADQQPGQPNSPQATVQLQPGEVPKIEFDTPVYDFGRTRTGKDVEHEFWFHNAGNGPLEIIQVKPSCGCTTSGQYDRVVQPGQSGKIPIKVATGHATGPFSKSITVVSNVPAAGSTVALQIKGELWQIFQATPNSALFGNVSTQQAKEGAVIRKLTVTNNSESPTKLGELKSNNPAFKSEIKELEPGKKWELTVALGLPLPTGVQSGMIELATGLADLPKLQVACSAYLVADVDVVPNKMMIPATRTVNLQRDFYVRNNATKPLKVYDLAASNQAMKVGMQETQTGVSYRITLDIPPDYKPAKDGDTVTFKTDNPNYPTLTIPITEQVAPPKGAVSTMQPPMKPGPTIVGPNTNAPVIQSTVKPATPPASSDAKPAPSGGK